ncbi:MAG TPA: hypothetical protein DCY55_06705 [Gammaproteobacteria bacterium]|nr:YcgL domain-containing protein [Pseudomonadota bacterium]HAY45961.1 hypothetical protein [Gammaproteobacteria bacterium]
MFCQVFKGSHKPDHFLYLPLDYDQSKLPTTLQSLLGELQMVVEFELTPDKKLAIADAVEVIAQLSDRGFYLQMPPGDKTPEDFSQ